MSEMSERSVGTEDEIRLADHIATIWSYRWLVTACVIVGLAVAFVITIKSPKVYESTATIVTPREGSGSSILGGLAAASGLLQQASGFSVPSLTPNRDLLISVLKSRSMAQAVVERFDLISRYQTRYLEDAIKRLEDNTTVSLSREGVVVVTVLDIDPALAAQMANFYVELLDRFVAQFGTGEAGRQRGFLAVQLARAKADLGVAEESLRRFQERNRAIVLQEQTRGAIEAAARLKGEIIAAQVQLQVMRNFATDVNPEIVALRRRIDELNRQLAQMEYGDGLGRQAQSSRRDFNVPFSRVPEVGLELARLTRDVKVQEALVTLLAQYVEQARIAEAKDLPTVQVLDRAVPAERYSKPRPRLNLAVGGTTSLLLGVFLAYFLEYFRRSTRHGARAA